MPRCCGSQSGACPGWSISSAASLSAITCRRNCCVRLHGLRRHNSRSQRRHHGLHPGHLCAPVEGNQVIQPKCCCAWKSVRCCTSNHLRLLPLGVGLVSDCRSSRASCRCPTLHQTEIVYGLFFGLIVASVVVLFREVKDYRLISNRAAVGAHWASSSSHGTGRDANGAVVHFPVRLRGHQRHAATPGVSGSFILLILGQVRIHPQWNQPTHHPERIIGGLVVLRGCTSSGYWSTFPARPC